MGDYKVGKAIVVSYVAPNLESGLGSAGTDVLECDIYDEANGSFLSSQSMTEIGNSGMYYMSFTPDAAGKWHARVFETVGATKKKVGARSYNVELTDISDIHSLASTIDGKIDALNDLSAADVGTAVASELNTYDAPTKAEMDTGHSTLETNIRGADSDTLKDLSDQIDGIESPGAII